MTTTEKSVEEMAKELAHEINDIFAIACKLEGEVNQEWLVNVIKEPLQAERQKREEVGEAERERIAKRIWEVADKNSWLYDEDHEDMVLYLNDIPAIIELALTPPNNPK